MFCRYCGASLADGTKFCTECGQRQPAAHKPVQNVCPRCGAVEEADAVFCSTCGARLGASAQPNGGYTQPNGGYTQPNGGYTQPNGGYTQPNGGYTQPNGGYTQPGAGYTQPGASARSGTAPGQSRTASGRAAAQQPVRPAGSFTVTAKPEARVLGIPVRGKALWVVLGVIAVIVIALVVLSRYGGGDRPEADDGGSAFSVRETVPAREETRDEAEQKQTLMPAGGLRERIEQTMGDREEQEEAGPETEDAETEPEAAAQPSRRDPNGYSTSETPTLADFQWADYDVLHGARPEGRETLGRGEVSGGWKCYMVDDPEGVSDSTMERLINVYIDMNGAEAVVTLDWFYAHDYGTDEGFDEDGPDSVFDGFWQDEMIGAVGPGRVELTDFWYLDGFEYAVGEFMWPDGVPAAMFLVRP